MGKAIRASALVLLLACSAHAGIIQYGPPQEQPPPPQSTQEATAEGHINNPPLVELVLSLFALI